MICENLKKNLEFCNCSYSNCVRKGKCCECIQHHVTRNQLPACCFPADAEKTHDRSFANFIKVWSKK